MKTNTNDYRGYRFPREIISHSVWLYHRFSLSFRDVEELLAKRGIIVSYETIRQWCRKFGPEYARKLKRRQGRLGNVWYLDEVFVKIRGELHYLWRAVDQDGDVIDILVQRYRNARAAKRFFRKLLKGQESTPWRLVTDKLKSYGAHQPTRQRERLMRRFKSAGQAQRFLSVHGVVQNLFRLGRHQLRSVNYRLLRDRSFKEWSVATAA
jgi:putative transposase